jgi:IS6 family transposase
VEELLAERGIEVDHVTVYRWVQRFALEFAGGSNPPARRGGSLARG